MKDKYKTADQPARDRICDDLDTTLVVEAAAGTGKTTSLVERILSGIISSRVSLAKTVAVTFTDFAAGELKLRLRSAIEVARQKYVSSPRTISLQVPTLPSVRSALAHSHGVVVPGFHSACPRILFGEAS